MNRSSCADQVGKGVFLAEGIHVKRQEVYIKRCGGCKSVMDAGKFQQRRNESEIDSIRGFGVFVSEPYQHDFRG